MNRNLITAIAIGVFFSAGSYFTWGLLNKAPAPEQKETVIYEDVDANPAQPKTPPASVDAISTFSAQGVLSIDARLANSHYLANTPSTVHLALNAKSKNHPGKVMRVPADVVLVIDRSGSMSGSRMEHALAAAEYVVDSLETGDRIAIVSYSSDSSLDLPFTEISASSRATVRQRLRSIRPTGGTCISCGLNTAENELRNHGDNVARVILLSDGQANSGVTDPNALGNIARRLEQKGTGIATVGVGLDYNEDLMNRVAVAGNGNHYFVENPSMLAKTLEAELQSMQQLVARRTILRFELAEGVKFVRGYDRDFQVNGQKVTVSLGDIPADAERTALLELELPLHAAGLVPITKLEVSYDDLVNDKAALVSGALTMSATDDDQLIAKNIDTAVAARIEQAKLADALVLANQQMERGEYEEAQLTMQRQYDATASANIRLDSPKLQKKLETYGSAMKSMDDESIATGDGKKRATKGNAALQRDLVF